MIVVVVFATEMRGGARDGGGMNDMDLDCPFLEVPRRARGSCDRSSIVAGAAGGVE